jgi:LPXTG-motif cell wall-anchored protein
VTGREVNPDPGRAPPAATGQVEALPSELPRTGSVTSLLAFLAGLALAVAGLLFFAETLVPNVRQRA